MYIHCIIISIYIVFTINVYVNIVEVTFLLKFYIYYCVDVTYTIFTYTFAPHLIGSKYIVIPNY